MNRRLPLLIAVISAMLFLLPKGAIATTYFLEDFESYTLVTDGDITPFNNPGTGTPWTVSHTANTVETEGDFSLVDTKNSARAFTLPSTVNFGPATLGGLTTPTWDPTGEAPGGLYMVSLSGGVPAPLFPSFELGTTPDDPELPDNDPWNSRIDNGTYTGASNDMISPAFSTVGATGDLWLHASVSAQLDDNGQAIFDIDISTDGGASWVNKFRRISPGTGRDRASGDFDGDMDVDGADFLSQQRLYDYSDCTTCGLPDPDAHDIDSNRRASDQRFSDWSKAFGPYTPLVATVADKNAGGHHGELDLNLGPIGGSTDVQVRFRHFESRDDEIIAIDNIRVDDVPPAGSASETIFLEDFNTKTLGAMDVYEFVYFFGAFGLDTGTHTPTISGHSWGAQDRPTIDYANENEDDQGPPVIDASGRYDVNVVQRKNVNHLGHPEPEGPLGEVPFAIIDPQAEPEDSSPSFLSFQSERLHTPLLDLTAYDTVILEWDSETIYDGDPRFGSVASVVLMLDNGDGIPNDLDTVINEPDKLSDITEPFTPFDQFAGGFFTGGDDPIFHHHRLDVSADVAGLDNVYVAWQFVSSRTDYWAIDNVHISGELAAGVVVNASVPEPTGWLLASIGIAAVGFTRCRTRQRTT